MNAPENVTSKEKLPDWLRRWYCLKGEPRFREAADEIERLQGELDAAEQHVKILRENAASHEPAPALTDRVPHDIAVKILRVRDLLVEKDYDEAYHVLYSIADPSYTSFTPWAELERTAQPPAVTRELLEALVFEHKDGGKFERARAEAATILRASETKPARRFCCFEDCDGDLVEGSEYCAGHLEQERQIAAEEASRAMRMHVDAEWQRQRLERAGPEEECAAGGPDRAATETSKAPWPTCPDCQNPIYFDHRCPIKAKSEEQNHGR